MISWPGTIFSGGAASRVVECGSNKSKILHTISSFNNAD